MLEDVKVPVSIWQLAPDRKSYGRRAGWFILVTPNGDDELAGPWPTVEAARKHADEHGWRVVPLEC